jgi:hypothetical protein
LIANWDLGLHVIVIVDQQAKRDFLGIGQNRRELNVLKGTHGKNVETFHRVQVTIVLTAIMLACII